MSIRAFTFDAKTLRGNFKPSSAAERDFYRALKKVAHASGHIVDSFTDGKLKIWHEKQMMVALEDYAKLIEPWASRQSAKLLDQVLKSNKRAYTIKSKAMGKALSLGIADPKVETKAQQLLREQVALIKSIPLEAGIRAQKIAYEAVLAGTRAEVNVDTLTELQKQMGMTTEVAVSRALLISRTETARANAAFNQARAQSVGSGQYRWHNSGDEAVRESHRIYQGKRLQGRIFSWDDPPTLSDGMRGHPGTFPNCRCFAEPVFPDE